MCAWSPFDPFVEHPAVARQVCPVSIIVTQAGGGRRTCLVRVCACFLSCARPCMLSGAGRRCSLTLCTRVHVDVPSKNVLWWKRNICGDALERHQLKHPMPRHETDVRHVQPVSCFAWCPAFINVPGTHANRRSLLFLSSLSLFVVMTTAASGTGYPWGRELFRRLPSGSDRRPRGVGEAVNPIDWSCTLCPHIAA